MSGKFATIEVADPHRTRRLIWEHLSPKERTWLNEREVWLYSALDQWRFRTETERIAVKQGFSNPSRFPRLFRRAFGTYPFEALRARSEG